MKFIVGQLVVVLLAYVYQADATCSYTMAPGLMNGYDIKSFSDISVDGCKHECDIDPKCQSFHYRTRLCYLKKHSMAPNRYLYKTYQFYRMFTKTPAGCTGSQVTSRCQYTRQSGNCNGHDIRTFSRMSLDTCKIECSNRLDCNSFHFLRGYCYLKNYVCTDRQLAAKGSPNTNQYVKDKNCPAYPGNTCDYTERPAAHCAGRVVQTLYKISIEACKAQCNNKVDCFGISYRTSDEICWIQNYACKENQLVYKGNPIYNHYTKGTCRKGSPVRCKFQRLTGDCPGYDLVTLSGASLAACQMECVLRPNCKSLQWRSKTCWLKNRICRPKEMTNTHLTMYNTFNKPDSCNSGKKCSFTKQYAYCAGTALKTLSRVTLGACFTECSMLRRCRGFVYRTKTCWLQSTKCTGRKLLYKGNRYYKYYTKDDRKCTNPPESQCSFKFQYGNCNGRDIKSYARVSLNFCKKECSNMPDCLSFHYNSARYCYLKRHICTDRELAAKNNINTAQYSKPESCFPRIEKTCKYKRVHPGHCGGHVIQTLTKVNVDTCRTECNNEVDCLGFSYRASDQICWLQNYACKENQLVYKNLPDYTHFTKQDCVKGTGVKCQYKLSYRDCQGHDILKLISVSLATCEMECAKRGSCKNFVFYNNNCYLKDYNCPTKEQWKGRTGNRYYKTFTKQGDCGQGAKCAFSLRYGNCPGYVIKTLTRTTLEACWTECSAIRHCLGFQYRSNICWLQRYVCPDNKLQYRGNRLYKQYTKKDVDCSASPARSCEYPKAYGNCNGHDIRSYGGVSFQFCKTACTHHIDCLSFHYNYVRACYLKNYICRDNQLAGKTSPLTNNYVKPFSCGPGFGRVCKYSQRHAECPGRNLRYLPKINLRTCQTECNNNRDCSAFQYRIGNCWLKNYDCKENQLTNKGDNNYHLYTKKECSPATSDPCEFSLANGDCTTVRNMKTLTGVSLPTCKMECSKIPACKSFQYRPNNCWLKGAMCSDSQLRYKGNRYYNQYRKTGKCKVKRGPKCLFKRRYGDCRGHDIKSYGDISLTACLDQCSMNKQCLTVHYRTRTCWLKNYVCSDKQLLYRGNRLYKQYDKTNPNCGTPPGDVCPFTSEQGLCNGYALRNYVPLSIEACRSECTRRIDCLSFWYHPTQRGCYLKSRVCKSTKLLYKNNRLYSQHVKSPSCKLRISRDYPTKTCNYRTRKEGHCGGHVIQTIMKIEPESCKTECDLKIDCLGFSYRWSDQACWLQNYACKENQLAYKGNKNYDHYTKLDCKKGTDVKCQFRRSFGTCGYSSYVWRIGTMTNVNVASCQQECSQRPECSGFQMRKNTCWLSDYNCRSSEMTAVGNRLQNNFVKTGQCTKGTPCKYSIRYGNCPGRVIKTLSYVDLETCKAECSRRHACWGFQYRGRVCWFQNYVCADNKLQYRGNRLYKQYTKNDRRCSIPPEKTCDFRFTQAVCNGHNYRTYADVSLQTCKTQCTIDINCLGFQYTYTRACYLKNFDCRDNQLIQRGKTGSSYYVKPNSCKPWKGYKCEYTHRNAECAGRNKQYFTKVTLSTCRTQCNNNRDCLGFQYRVGYCYLKYFDCNEQQLTFKGNANYHLYTKKNTECRKARTDVCEFERVHGDCYKARNIKTLTLVSLRTCQMECSKRRECKNLHYRTTTCWLKDRICSDAELRYKGNRWYNQFRKTANCKLPQLPVCRYRRRYGLCSGHDIKSFSGITLETCQAECSQRKSCLLIHYRSRSCWLKNYVCPFNKLAAKGNRLYKEYVKENQDCGRAPSKPCTFKSEQGSCNGHDIGTYRGMTKLGCQIECTRRVDCWSFFYYAPSKTCYLKNYICASNRLAYKNNWYYNQNIKPDDCDPLGKVCDYSHEHLECAGHDIKVMRSVDLDTCRTQCNNDHDCLAFQYYTTTCFIKNYDCKSNQMSRRGDRNFNLYTKKSCRKGRGKVCRFTRQFGQCRGHDLFRLNAVLLSTCKMECSRREKCLGAFYQRPNCFLKNYVCSSRELAYKGYRYMQQFTKDSTCPANEGKICSYTERRGECVGYNILTLTDVAFRTCRAQCAVTKACKGFQYRSRYCWLKNYECKNKQLRYTNYMHYRQFSKQMPCHKSPAKVCRFEQVNGACNGYDIKRLDRVSLEACMAECTARYNCFSFYYTGVYCYLKRHICTGRQLASKQIKNRQYNRATSCKRVRGKLCEFNTRAGYCNRYNFKTYNKVSLRACRIECSNRMDCVSIMYSKSAQRCFLKNNLCKDHEISLRTSKDYSVGVKTTNCRTAPRAKCAYSKVYGDCAGHDVQTLRDVHMDTCLAQCNARDDCYSVLYVLKTCYLKKYVCKPNQIRYKGNRNYWLFTKEKKCIPLEPCTCRFQGDPHFYTFDGTRIDFQGPCKYTAAETIDQNDPCSFKVETKHEYRGNHVVSYVRIVDLKMFGHVIRLQKGNIAFADGKRITMPAIGLFGQFDVTYSGGYMTAIAKKCKVSIRYNGNYMASMTAPGKFRGKMRGICGSCNGNRADDWKTKEGKNIRNAWAVGNSYEVPDDSDMPLKKCKKPEPAIKCHGPLKTAVSTNKYCGYIKDVKGPFGACIRSNKADHKNQFKGCRYDVCAFGGNRDKAKAQACRALDSFANKCQSKGYRVKLWRTTNFCPKKCGPGKRYSQRANSCPNTCANPVGNFICNKPPVAGCECKPGFVLEGTACIPVSNCKAKPGPPCLKKVDLVFVMDSSGSVGATNFRKMKAFMANIVASMGRVDANHVQVGVVRFSTGATEVMRLNQYRSSAAVQKAIVQIPYVRGWTYTSKALHLTRVQALAASHGRRGGNVNAIVIVLTDGGATDAKFLAKESDALRQHATIVAVGIGRGVNQAQLKLMAGGSENVVSATSFTDLSNKIKGVLSKTCNCPIGFRVRNYKCVFASCPDGYQQVQDGKDMSCKKRKCKIGFIYTNGKCRYRACPGGYIALVVNGKVTSCWPNQDKKCPVRYHATTLNGKKVCTKNHVTKCAAGSKVATVNGKRVCNVPTSGGCPRGLVENFVGAKRVCSRPQPKGCSKGTKMATINGKRVCYKGQGCPLGFSRQRGRCVFIRCPRGYVRRGNRCRRIPAESCPAGTTQGKVGFTYVCLKNKGHPCPKGSVQATFGGRKVCYRWPRTFKCPTGYIKVNYRCVREQRKCKKGTIAVVLNGQHTCSKRGPKCPRGMIEGQAGKQTVCTRPGFVCPTGYRKEGMKCIRLVHPGYGCASGRTRIVFAGRVYCIRSPAPGKKCTGGRKLFTLRGRRICARGPGKKGCPRGTNKITYQQRTWCLRVPGPKPGHCFAGFAKIVWGGKTYCFRVPAPNTPCPAGGKRITVGKNTVCVRGPGPNGKCPAGRIVLRFKGKTYCIRAPAGKPTRPVTPVKEKCAAGLTRISWMGQTYCIRKMVPGSKCPSGRYPVRVGKSYTCARKPGKRGTCRRGTLAFVYRGRKYCLRGPGPAPEPPLTCAKGFVKLTLQGHSFCLRTPGPTQPCPKGYARQSIGGRICCVRHLVAGKCPPGHLRIVYNKKAYCMPLATPKPGTCPSGLRRLVYKGHAYCLSITPLTGHCPPGTTKTKYAGRDVCMRVKPPSGKCPAGRMTLRWSGKVFCLRIPFGPGTSPNPAGISCPKGTKERSFGSRVFCVSPPGNDGNCAQGRVPLMFGGQTGCILPPGPSPEPRPAHCPKGMESMGVGADVFCVYSSNGGCKNGMKKIVFYGMTICAPTPVNGKCANGFKQYTLPGHTICVKDQLPAGTYCPHSGMSMQKFGGMQYCVMNTVKTVCTHGLNRLKYNGKFICVQAPGKIPSVACPEGTDGQVYNGIPFCTTFFSGTCSEGTTRMDFDGEEYCVINYAPGTHKQIGGLVCPLNTESKVIGGITFCFKNPVGGNCPDDSKQIVIGGTKYCFVAPGPGGTGAVGCPKNTLTAEINGKTYCLPYAIGGRCPADYIRDDFNGQLVCYKKSIFTCPARHHLKNGVCEETKCPADMEEGVVNGERMCYQKFTGTCPEDYSVSEYNGHKVCYMSYVRFTVVCSNLDRTKVYNVGQTYEDSCTTYKCTISGPKTIEQKCPANDGSCHKPGEIFSCPYGDHCSCEINDDFIQYTLPEEKK